MTTCSGRYSNEEACTKCRNKVTCILVNNAETRVTEKVLLLDERLLLVMQALSRMIDDLQELKNSSQVRTEIVEAETIQESNSSEVIAPKGLVATVKAKFKGNGNAS